MLTAWALALGGDAGTVSSVQSLATAAQAVHLPAAIASTSGSRKRITVAALLLARLAWLPLALFALAGDVGPRGRALLLVTAGLSAVLGMLSQNAYGTWIGDTVPAPLRGRFFGTRTWVAAIGGAFAALVMAAVLDGARGGAPGPRSGVLLEGRVPLPVLAGIALLVVALGLVSGALLGGATELSVARPQRDVSVSIARARALLADPALRRFLRYQIFWGVAVAPGAAFFAMHVLTTMRGGFRLVAMHGIVLVLARVCTARLWGARVDRLGAPHVLALCSLGIGVMPLLWAFCDEHTWWPLAIDAVLAGVLWGGHQIAVSAHPLGIGDVEDRPFVLAWSSLALGLAWALAALVAGSLVRVLPADALGIGPYRVLFVFSGLARASCAWWALRLARTPRGAAGLHADVTRSHA